MGVPKFYRWLSERYPCLSEVVKEQQIPAFDNLYLDMNGIIHNCSHPNDEDPHFRITEEKIFNDIFHYIEFLFRMIKPRKVFFMAVDGVAPRAKMNQQRGRRFRSARDAELLRQQAISKGEILPEEKQFDSNCITPGTDFMARLQTQLKFFVTMKISTDKSWQKCKIYLSGHETPGEGEHKIMDFIRFNKARPDYDPNTRHCLYGLDADLIMLGLCSHEPHFSVLREEVTYGKKNQKRDSIPEQITFHLLHLSLLRDYISHEFQDLKGNPLFTFDLEKIIDDWVLMGFLVGNDFIPHLPGFHIHKNALPNLYRAYIEVRPQLPAYINEDGFLNLESFQIYLKRLAQMDLDQFKEISADFKYLESKSSRGRNQNQQVNNSGCILDGLAALDDEFEDNGFEDADSDNSDEISNLEFNQHKRNYYITKMEYESVTKEVLKEQATEYVRAIQWNLHYYYNGIVSWSWYYPHHYAPYISDVTNFTDLVLEYETGRPFLPFQQLLGVLPEASKEFLPLPFQALMTEDDSPLKKFYPTEFQLDQNGKQNEWEAVVLIPFIDERLLVSCMDAVNDRLTEEERHRNTHGPHLLYSFTEESLGTYHSTLPNIYPDISLNHARCEELPKNTFFLSPEKLKKGLCDGVRLDSYTPGFPVLRHIPHTAKLTKTGSVSVFNSPVRNECMILTLRTMAINDLMELSRMLDKEIYVGWPHLKEAKVKALSDGTSRLQLDGNRPSLQTLSKFDKEVWKKRAASVDERYMARWGVEIGTVDFIVEATMMNGKRFAVSTGGELLLEKQWMHQITYYPMQAVVQDIPLNVKEEDIFKTVDDLFPPGLHCFCLSSPHYGSLAVVEDKNKSDSTGSKKIPVKICVEIEVNLTHLKKKDQQMTRHQYMPLYQLAQGLCIDRHMISRFTGTFLVQTNVQESMHASMTNIGLNLKFNKKNEEVPGFSKKDTDGNWLYSHKTLNIMSDYLQKFPELFENLTKVMCRDSVHVDELFPGGNGKAYIQKVQAWLKELPSSTQPRRTCGSMFLDPAVVEEIERIVNMRKLEDSKVISCQLEPHQLYRPLPSQYLSVPDNNATFMLFDRVVNVREGYSVPLGLRGTIIGLPGSTNSSSEGQSDPDALYDIVFDEDFHGGITLNCSENRGYRLNASALINITYGQRGNKSSQDSTGKQRNQSKSTANNSSNSYAKALHPPKPNNSNLNDTTPPVNRSAKNNANTSSDNGMVRLEWTGSKPRRRLSQEPPPASTNQFNHSPHSPFVPHLFSSGGNKTSPVSSEKGKQFVTPKAPTHFQPTKKTNHAPLAPSFNHQQNQVNEWTVIGSGGGGGGGGGGGKQDEFTSIWGELKNANSLSQGSPNQAAEKHAPSQPAHHLGNSKPPHTEFTKVSVDEILQKAKAAEEASKQEMHSQMSTPRSAVMQLMELIYSSSGEHPIYQYFTYGPTPLYGAELRLPGWQHPFCSTRFHPSKELASENAAEQALLALQKLTSGPIGASVRPSHPPPFKSAPFPPIQAPTVVKDHSLSSAAMMLPLVPPGGGQPQPLLGPPQGVRSPAPPSIYNIPQSYVAHNHMLASQWEEQRQRMQQNIRQQHQQAHRSKQKHPAQQIYQPPGAFNKKQGPVSRQQPQQQINPLNINAIEFVPTQVARKQAVGSHKVGNNTSAAAATAATTARLENLSLSPSEPKPPPAFQENSRNDTSFTPEDLFSSQSTPTASTTNTATTPTSASKTKRKSRLAVKFNSTPD